MARLIKGQPSDWEIQSAGGNNITARNSDTKATFSGTVDQFNATFGTDAWVVTTEETAEHQAVHDAIGNVVQANRNPLTGGIALSAGSSDVSGQIARDIRFMGRAGNLPPTMTSLPTVSFAANSAATLGTIVAVTDPRITLVGASWTYGAGITRYAPITSDPSGAGAAYSDPSTAYAGQSSGAIEFWSDASKIELRLVASYARVYVDQGAGLQLVGTPAGVDGSGKYLQIDWSAVKAPRFYRIELMGTIAGIHSANSIYLAATDSIWSSAADTYKGIVIGDSFAEGTGATYKFDGCFQQLGRLLGVADWRVCGAGGTGIVAANVSPARGNYQTRLSADVLTKGPFDLVVIEVSGNDTSNTATIPAGLSSILTQIRASMPLAKIIVMGTWRPRDTAEAAYNAVDTAAQAGITASGLTGITFISQVGWITGSGKVGTTTGTGNADFYTGSDGTHPSQAGHDYRAQRMAYEIKRALLA